ncbi:MAG TPA: tRNA lysidine(34) synthetase TilS [Alphaproteobacteria bacterium]
MIAVEPDLLEASDGHVPAPAAPAAAVSDAMFAALIERLGPFERRPRLAVGVSGGADSLALVLLADRWLRSRGGQVTALTVDHGLRPESAAEAAQVGEWLARRGIAHHVLRWEGTKPRTGIQHAAREARRALLLEWCRQTGVLHLLLAHHRDDQLETMLLRQAHGSGPDGLAAMAAVIETSQVRILRPLLDVPGGRLKATLRHLGQPWIEDPSNRDPTFERVRIRQLLAAPAGGTAGSVPVPLDPRRFGAARAAREAEVAALLAAAVAIYPEGWAVLDPIRWRAADTELSRRALTRILLAIGGAPYPPRGERLERLHDVLRRDALGGGHTLAGCRILPRRGGILFVREPAAAAHDIAIDRAGTFEWDGRFVVKVAGSGPREGRGYRLARLGRAGWAEAAAADPAVRQRPIPPAVRPSLPALWDLDGVVSVPHLLYRRQGTHPVSVEIVSMTFRPRHALAGPGFFVS